MRNMCFLVLVMLTPLSGNAALNGFPHEWGIDTLYGTWVLAKVNGGEPTDNNGYRAINSSDKTKISSLGEGAVVGGIAKISINGSKLVMPLCALLSSNPAITTSKEECLETVSEWTWGKPYAETKDAEMRHIVAGKTKIVIPWFSSVEDQKEAFETGWHIKTALAPVKKEAGLLRGLIAELFGRVDETETAIVEIGAQSNATAVTVVRLSDKVVVVEERLGKAETGLETAQGDISGIKTINLKQSDAIASNERWLFYTWIGVTVLAVLFVLAMIGLFLSHRSSRKTNSATAREVDDIKSTVNALPKDAHAIDPRVDGMMVELNGLTAEVRELQESGWHPSQEQVDEHMARLEGTDGAGESQSDSPASPAEESGRDELPPRPALAVVKTATKGDKQVGEITIPASLKLGEVPTV